MSPSGQTLISRFTDLRELGGMTVRIWYWREAILRTREGFPFGIGLNQGYVHADKLGSMGTHDYWLDLSSELGVPGVLLWIVFLVVLWRRLRAITRTPGWEWEGRALQVAFWLNQFHTLVEPTFQSAPLQYLYFWVMGGYSGYHAVTRMERETAPAGGSATAAPETEIGPASSAGAAPAV
jgi:O-antigen ligase